MYWCVLACTILPNPIQGYRIPDVVVVALSKVMKMWLKALMELVCTVLIYHSVKKSHEHMFWYSNTSSDGVVGAYCQ